MISESWECLGIVVMNGNTTFCERRSSENLTNKLHRRGMACRYGLGIGIFARRKNAGRCCPSRPGGRQGTCMYHVRFGRIQREREKERVPEQNGQNASVVVRRSWWEDETRTPMATAALRRLRARAASAATLVSSM